MYAYAQVSQQISLHKEGYMKKHVHTLGCFQTYMWEGKDLCECVCQPV